MGGCREAETPRSFNKAMVEAGQTLPPPFPAWHDVTVAGGSAEWIAFREPNPPAGGDQAGGEVEEQIRNLIDSFNGMVADGEHDELSSYFVPAQQKSAGVYIVGQAKLGGLLTQLSAALKERAPEQAAAVDAIIEPLAKRYNPELNIQSIKSVSATRAEGMRLVPGVVASAPDMAVPIGFELIEDEWFIDYPLLQTSVILAAPMEMSLTVYWGSLLQGLQAGVLPPKEVLRQLAIVALGMGVPLPPGVDLTPPTPPPGMAPPGVVPPDQVPPSGETPPAGEPAPPPPEAEPPRPMRPGG